MKSFQSGAISVQTAILLGCAMISLSSLLGSGVIRIKGISVNGNGTAAPTAQVPAAPDGTAPAPAPTGPVTVDLDDDPTIGDKNAPVTIVEFSDYECPFCQRHFQQTWPSLKKDYIDTGKVKLVYRDYPLSFHAPMAVTNAIAADCAREQGGDSAYFKYHDELFTRTKTGGSGLTKDDLTKIATDLGMNANNLKSCVDSEKYKDEVDKDAAYGNTVGVSGTPSFFVGKSGDKQITGSLIVGAQPYSAFQQAIDPLLQ